MLALSPEPEAHDKVLDNVIQIELEFGNQLVFEERGKPEVPGEKLSRSKDENQQQTQPTYDRRRVLESNPGHIDRSPAWEVNAQPLRHPCSPDI